MKHLRNGFVWTLILLSCLCMSGCLNLIRRTPTPHTAATDPPGNQSEQTDVQDTEALTPPAQAAEETLRTTAGQTSTAAPQTPAAQADIAQIYRPERSRKRQETIRQVNEYAFWCIENNMWNEARSHLEQGLQQDSLSASIHNNLGIVYERLGLVEKATAAYKKARALNQVKKAYAINLQLFEQRQAVQTDSTETPEAEPEPFEDNHDEAHPPQHTGD